MIAQKGFLSFRGSDIVLKVFAFLLLVAAGLAFKVFITSQSIQEIQLAKGSKIHLIFKASSVKTY